MSASFLHVLEQGPVLATLGRAALSGLNGPPKAKGAPAVPGPWIEAELPPRSPELINDYIRNVGGDPANYKGRVPAHMFPQWAMPLGGRALASLPYPLMRVMNAGSRIEQRAPIPAGEPLQVRARIESIDDDGRRALIIQKVITGTKSSPEAMISEIRAFVPLKSDKDKSGPKKERPTVPVDAHEVAFLRIPRDAGLDFAKLTGDFNPIHWIPAYAKASGFKTTILHGFGTFARTIEALNRGRFAGNVSRLKVIDARFTRPLPLPSRVGVYVNGSGSGNGSGNGNVWVGDAPGGGAYLEGHYEESEASK